MNSGALALCLAVVGAGLQGRRLAISATAHPELKVGYVVDLNSERAKALAVDVGASTSDLSFVLSDPAVTAVAVATPPDSHSELVIAALAAGKHVFCEKPLAPSLAEARTLVEHATCGGRVLWTGLNHRYYPAMKALFAQVGDERVLEIRCTYGIGGDDALARSWRRDATRVSGGHLVEQGIHAIDLALLLAPGLTMVAAVREQLAIGSTSGPLEDIAHLLLRSPSGTVASIQSTLLQWINMFRLEVATARALMSVTGLGPSYGDQTLTVVERQPGPFTETVRHFRGSADGSYAGQWSDFIAACRDGRAGDVNDGVRALAAVFTAYAAADQSEWLPLPDPIRPSAGETRLVPPRGSESP